MLLICHNIISLNPICYINPPGIAWDTSHGAISGCLPFQYSLWDQTSRATVSCYQLRPDTYWTINLPAVMGHRFWVSSTGRYKECKHCLLTYSLWWCILSDKINLISMAVLTQVVQELQMRRTSISVMVDKTISCSIPGESYSCGQGNQRLLSKPRLSFNVQWFPW